MEKEAWRLTGTGLPGKVGLLAEVLVKTMAMTNVWIFCLRRYHQLIPEIGHRWLGVHYIQKTLGRVSHADPMGIGTTPCSGFHGL
jgi:hypothetical protein